MFFLNMLSGLYFLAEALQMSLFCYCFNISWFLLVIVYSASSHLTKSVGVASFISAQAFSERVPGLPSNQLGKEGLKWKGSPVWKAQKDKTSALKSCSELSACENSPRRKWNTGARESRRIGVLPAPQLPPGQAFPPDKALLFKRKKRAVRDCSQEITWSEPIKESKQLSRTWGCRCRIVCLQL